MLPEIIGTIFFLTLCCIVGFLVFDLLKFLSSFIKCAIKKGGHIMVSAKNKKLQMMKPIDKSKAKQFGVLLIIIGVFIPSIMYPFTSLTKPANRSVQHSRGSEVCECLNQN